MYLQLPLRQWGAGNVYLLVLPSWKVNIAENPIAKMGLYTFGHEWIYWKTLLIWIYYFLLTIFYLEQVF